MEDLMLEQLILLPELRIVVLEKIEQSSGRPPKYLVAFGGEIELMTEARFNLWVTLSNNSRGPQ